MPLLSLVSKAQKKFRLGSRKGFILEREVVENHERYMQRVKLYRSFGYDIVQERNSILEKSRPITGKILEIGTGKGHFTRVLAAEGHPFISVDLSEEDQRMEIGRAHV